MQVTILHINPEFRRSIDVPMGKRHPTMREICDHYEVAWMGELGWHDIGKPIMKLREGQERNKDFLSGLWRTIEKGGSDCPIPRLALNPDAIRSFMVGDIVLLDGEPWVCDGFGWSQWESTKEAVA